MSGSQTAPWTVARLLAWTREHFERTGVESPRLCAEILLAHAMRCERIRLFTQHEVVPDDGVLATFRESVREAATGMPIAYLTGTKEFFSLTFNVSKAVLIPRPETELLVERAIWFAKKSAGPVRAILDIGTGSGCIAVALARHLPNCRVFASDVSADAIEVAKLNAIRHGVDERIEFRQGDLFEPWNELPSIDGAVIPGFDLIVSNPPYVSTRADNQLAANVRANEPHVALFGGLDGLDVIRRIVREAPGRLAADGQLLIEIGYDQSAAMRELLAGAAWMSATMFRDGGGIERVVCARRRIAEEQVA